MDTIQYTSFEIYKLYRMFMDEKWRNLTKFFLGVTHEPSSARETLKRIKNHFLSRRLEPRSSPIKLGDLKSSERCSVKFDGIRWLIFYEPLKNMPLYINYRGYNLIAMWRLELGK